MQREQVEQQFRNELEWLTGRRWFGDKARPVTDVSVLHMDEVEIGDQVLILPLVEFTHSWGDPSVYFVPIIEGEGTLAERDAVAHVDVLRWFVDGFVDERVIGDVGIWRWRTIGDAVPDMNGLPDDAFRVITGEQSNTSIRFGDGAIGKIFRRSQSGKNPDLEIGEYLMGGGANGNVPELYGVIELDLKGEQFDIAALQQFVPNIGDGWSWLLGLLGDKGHRSSLLDDVRLLGTRTGELHLALARQTDDAAFVPEQIGEDEAQAIIQRVIGEMEASVEGLAQHLQPDEVERLHKGLGMMMGDAWSMVGTMLIRVHGDYHLGQTLRTQNHDFAVIDFEGEPNRSMAERRQKLPALKDVAGMVRSLDYAGATLIQQSDDDEEKADIAAWVKDASDAFVAAYREAISPSLLPLVPDNESAFNSVLNLMIAEKALYELRYEMNNRPDWLWIPLGALHRLVDTEEIS